MAENKKSFLLYSDLIGVINQLPDEQAGKLFKIILEYVNDKNPVVEDLLLKVAFEPIKLQLKRDLRRYEEIREKRREAGIASAESKKQNQQVLTSVESVKQTSTKSTVNDNVNVNDIKEKRRRNSVFVKPKIEEVNDYFSDNGYTNKSADKFFKYYDVSDWHDSKGKKIVNWKQKAQSVWFKDENKITGQQKSKLSI